MSDQEGDVSALNAGVGINRGLTANKEAGCNHLHSHSTLRSNLESLVRLFPTHVSDCGREAGVVRENQHKHRKNTEKPLAASGQEYLTESSVKSQNQVMARLDIRAMTVFHIDNTFSRPN